MCIVLDANFFGSFDNPDNEEMVPVRRWLWGQNGKIVYADAPRVRREWKEAGAACWRDSGRMAASNWWTESV